MDLPIIGRIDLKSVVLGVLIMWLVVPWALGMVNRPTQSRTAA